MTDQLFDLGLEAFAIPSEAIVLNSPGAPLEAKAMVVKALQQELKRRNINIPIGPDTALHDPDRLLLLNRIAVQIVTAGILSDQIDIPIHHWEDKVRAPQLIAAGLVDDENDIVYISGVLTAEQFINNAVKERNNETITLDVSCFEGGLERLITYVLLLKTEALPRFSISERKQILENELINLSQVFKGLLDDNIRQLWGAKLQPAPAAAFRGTTGDMLGDQSNLSEVLSIPLALGVDGLLSGMDIERGLESFELKIARVITSDNSKAIQISIIPELSGDLLPDGLALDIRQSGYSQRIEASASTRLVMNQQIETGVINIRIEYPGAVSLN